MTRDEIIRLAREACDKDKVDAWHNGFWTVTQEELERFAALVAAAEREKSVQEPVAWMVYTLDGKSVCVTDNPADFTEQHRVLPLYTHPAPALVPLTDEQIDEATADVVGLPHEIKQEIARSVEHAHGIGGEA